MDRRQLLGLGLSASMGAGLSGPVAAKAQQPAPLVPLRLSVNEIFRTTVCLRPFRAAGPRIEAQALGRKTLVHNYGHGGSGWSLSWGSAFEAVRIAMQSSPRRIAVIGAGAIGLTTALTAQQAGAEVTIYAHERYPFVRSAHATGVWSPDSRIAKTDSVSSGFADQWERMARRSWTLHNSFVATPGDPVEWMDHFGVRPLPAPPELVPFTAVLAPAERPDPGMIYLENRLHDIVPRFTRLPNDQHIFNSEHVNRRRNMTFNVTSYARQLEHDFLAAGGAFVHARFAAPSELSRLKESVIINCTGYGARALFKDDTVIPVRGQIVWLAPQDNAHYGFYYNGVSVLARRDGIVVQASGPDDNFGMNDDNEVPDMAAAHASIEAVKGVYRPT